MLDVPSVLAFPERGIRPMHRARAGGNYLLSMQWRLGQGDTAGVRQEFNRVRTAQRNVRPGDISFDATYNEARLLLALGDTVEATQLLDLSLQALSTLGGDLLDQLPQVTALVRGMSLRAGLADRAGDPTTARRWAGDVLTLWSDADQELHPTITTMRRIAGAH
jgi:hypothetical protein